MWWLYGIGIAQVVVGLFFLLVAVRSRNSDYLITVSGELTRIKGFKNVRTKYYFAKNMSDYIYTYTVGNKRYKYRGSQLTHPRKVLKRITIVYLKGFPRIAYAEHFSGHRERMFALCFIVSGILWIGLAVLIS